MPLTAEDVSNKRFTTVRLREGYDMTEVDQFLDEVEAELRRLHAENDELGANLRAAGIEPTTPATDPSTPSTGAADESGEEQAAAGPKTVVAGSGADGTGTTAAVETLKVTTTAEASAAAPRLLEIAGRSADELVAEAEQRAGQIVGDARATAE